MILCGRFPLALMLIILIGAGVDVRSDNHGLSTEQRYRAAREAAYAGEHDTAVRLYHELLSEQPDNTDYLLGLGQTLTWQGNPDAAIPHLQYGIDLAPDYADLHQALYQALLAANRHGEAERVRAAAAARFEQPEWTRAPPLTPATGPRLQLTLSNQLEFPSQNQPDWRLTGLEFGMRTDEGHRLAAQIQDNERFGLRDTVIGLNGYYQTGAQTGVYAYAAFSPDHRVMPRETLHLQLSHSLANGWGAIAGIKFSGYRESDVLTADLGIERYFGDYRLAYTLIHADANTTGATTGHRIQFGRYFDSGSHLQLAWTTGEEIEKPVDAGILLSSSVDTLAIWGEVRLTTSFGLLFGLGKTWIAPVGRTETDREFIELGLRHYF